MEHKLGWTGQPCNSLMRFNDQGVDLMLIVGTGTVVRVFYVKMSRPNMDFMQLKILILKQLFLMIVFARALRTLMQDA